MSYMLQAAKYILKLFGDQLMYATALSFADATFAFAFISDCERDAALPC